MDRSSSPNSSGATSPAELGGDQVLRILESISDGFFALDEHWCFTFINELGRRLLKPLSPHAEAKLIGRNVWEAFPAAVGTNLEQEYRRAARRGAGREQGALSHAVQQHR